jgi:hypothetical protein
MAKRRLMWPIDIYYDLDGDDEIFWNEEEDWEEFK